MAITAISRDWGIAPSIVRLTSTDAIATVVGATYLADQLDNIVAINGGAFQWVEGDICLADCSDGPVWLKINSDLDAFEYFGNAGEVVLPTIANHLAVFSNTTGTLTDDVATAINGGNLQAGLSGTAGYLASFPATAARGSFRVFATANVADTLVSITNEAHGQATAYTLPDVGAATGQLLNKTAAFVVGNLVAADSIDGVCIDSGVAVANVQTVDSIKAVRTGDLGGGGATIVITDADALVGSVVTLNIVSSTNAVGVQKVTPGAGNITVLLDGDPGAACVFNYIMFIAAQ